MKKYVLALSGGFDSAAMLFEYKEQIALAVAFKYPSVHNKRELRCAKRLAKKANVPLRVINVSKIFAGMNSDLLQGEKDTEQTNQDPLAKNYVIPFRNGIFLSILAGIAESEKIDGVMAGIHFATRHAPDASEAFCDAFSVAAKEGTVNDVEFFYPYAKITKHEVAERGIAAGLNPDWTYTCFAGGRKPCGQCPACLERQKGLEGLTW